MSYKLSTKKRIDLSYLGEDSAGTPFFVDIKNAKMMTYDEKMQLAELAPKADSELSQEMKDNLKKLAGSLVVSWNLISLVDESPVQVPSVDPDAFGKIPSEVIEAIMKGLKSETNQADEATKNSSAQSDKSSEGDRLQETSTTADTTN